VSGIVSGHSFPRIVDVVKAFALPGSDRCPPLWLYNGGIYQSRRHVSAFCRGAGSFSDKNRKPLCLVGVC
jgi:hypothetical protein